MTIPESAILDTPNGRVPSGPGWFILNLAGARATTIAGHGTFCGFEPDDHRFEQLGVNVHVISPGEGSALYHAETDQEGFFVLAGECIAIVEEQERRLRTWDYLHCPPGTRHSLVGAGDGPCAILMLGVRRPEGTTHYPVSALASRHGVGAPAATDVSREAYEAAGWDPTEVSLPMPWPPSSTSAT
jgi:uncharacterized cupin superfamily protein